MFSPAFAQTGARGGSTESDRVFRTVIDGVNVNLWLPKGVKTLRAAVVFPSDPRVGAENLSWIETCRPLAAAQIGMELQDMNRNSRETILKNALLATLTQFAGESGHPELITAPLFFTGMSRGGVWSASLAKMMPQRTLGYANVCGWVQDPEPAALHTVPALFVLGSVEDDFHMLKNISTEYDPARRRGAQWTLALQWELAHEFGIAYTLAIPFFEWTVRARLSGDRRNAGPVLKTLREQDGWLGDRGTWDGNFAVIAPWAKYTKDRSAAVWLPNQYLACVWRALQSRDAPLRLDAAVGDGTERLLPRGSGKPRRLVVSHSASVTLEAILSPTVSAAPLIKSVQFFDGDRAIGKAVPVPPWRTTWKPSTAGAHAVYICYQGPDGREGVSPPARNAFCPAVRGQPSGPFS
jgi:hypothetical protein